MGLGKHEQPGGIAVEAMNQADRCVGIAGGDIASDDRQRGRTFLFGDGAREQAGGLVDDEQVIVLMNEPQRMQCRQRSLLAAGHAGERGACPMDEPPATA